MSIERIAERAHTGKAVIYRRWPHRLDLVVEALDRSLPGPESIAPDTGSLRGDLLAVLRRIAEGMADVRGARSAPASATSTRTPRSPGRCASGCSPAARR